MSNYSAGQDERVLNRPYAPPKKRKPKRPAQPAPTAAQDERVLASPGPAHPGPAPVQPLGKPVRVLATHGFMGSMEEFVDRLRQATQVHEQTFGYRPSPGFAFDLARWQGQFNYDRLFGGNPEQLQKERDVETERGFLEAAKGDGYAEYLDKEEVQELVKRKPWLGVKAGAIALSNLDSELRFIKPDPGKQLGGFLGVGPVGEVLWKGSTQVADALVHAPGGLYATSRAIEKDILEGYSHPEKKPLPRTRAIAKQIGKQTAEDVRHPLRNPGYLFLDALGLASAGGGVLARGSAATKTAKAGKGPQETAKALIRRPEPGRFKVSKGGASEEVPLSENATVRAVQRLNLQRRQKAMEKRHEFGPGVGSVFIPQRARDFLQKHFSLETKLGREARTRQRYEQTLALSLKRELDALAGRSITQSRVFGRMPKKLRAGLTRGEQKAIQVLATDDLNPLQANRAFHERMIEAGIGDVKAHKRHLADLKLAEKALKNPRPRFEKALALTRQVIAEQERIKVDDLGLDPRTAEKRVIAGGEAMRGEPLREGKRQRQGSFYLPQVPKGKSKRAPYERIAGPRVGPGGIPPPRALPELRHVYEGKAIQAGNIRIDATALAGEAYARTVRAAAVKNDYNRLWSAATDRPKSIFDRPIRDIKDIPEKLRIVWLNVDEGRFTAKDAEDLHPKEIQSIHESLYPGRENPNTGRWELDEDIKGVKWVDSRLMGDQDRIPQVPGALTRTAQFVNEPFRAITLYARPAYILNLLGNAGMGLIHQGPFLVPNMMRAIQSKRLYGPEATRTMEALIGEGKARSYIAEGASPRLSKGMATFWSRITDRDMRMSALIHELHRKGYDNPEKIKAVLKDKTKQPEVIEASRRANKAMVEFDNLTWYEKNYFRHFIFVYPWVSRSGVWSIRTVLEHPIKTGFLSHLGRMSQEDNDEYFKHAPEWFKRTGYFPTGFENGKPKVVNPTSVNSFATIAELLTTAESGVTDVPYAATEDLLGPFASFMLHGISGRDEFGNEYPDGAWVGSAQDLLTNLPQARAIERAKQKANKQRPIDITDRGTLGKRERAALKNTVFSPGWLNGYGSLIVGGFSPRLYDPDSAAARYWRDRPMKERHQHEMGLIRKALSLQGELLDKPVPAQVTGAVNFAGKRELTYKTWQQENGRDPTAKEKTLLDIDLLKKGGRISGREVTDLKAKLKQKLDKEEVESFRGRMLELYADAEALREWDENVRWVASFKPNVVKREIDFLRKQGLLDSAPVHEKDLAELGRKTLQFREEAKIQAKRLDRQDLTADERKQLTYEIQLWEASQDKAIVIDGHRYPSPIRFAWAKMSEKERQNTVDSAVTGNWKTLSPFEKQLVGKKVDPKVVLGWQIYERQLPAAREQLRVEGERLDPAYATSLAKWIEKYGDDGKPIPGFYKDFLHERKPLFRRMQTTKQIQKSPNAETWNTIFQYATAMERFLNNDNYRKEDVRRTWKEYVEQSFYGWATEDPDFKRELDRYGGLPLLQRLIN